MARAQQDRHGSSILTAAPSSYTPIRESHDVDLEEAVPGSLCRRCCCFGWGWGWGRKINQESSNKYLLRGNYQDGDDHEDSWVVKRAKELKELSEVIAGPKWKNMIRKVGKYFKPKKSTTHACYNYTPQSYALNFDDGGVEEDADLLFPNFSSRFSAPHPLINQQQKIPS